jgi:UDP-N-acetylmuramoylalanine--D-glutamate ligase
MAAYAAAKARVLRGRVAVVGLDDPLAAGLLDDAAAPVRVGFRLGEPAAGQLGVLDGLLVDRAFSSAGSAGLALAPVASISVPGPAGVLDALAAAALARCVGVPAAAIEAALASFEVGRHRAALVAVADGISYVDDSKATNPHAAEASVLAYPRVVWVAGGLLKGASDDAVNALVARIADRLVGAVLIGRDRAQVAKALSRHAPNLPVVKVVTSEDIDMGEAAEISDAHVSRMIDVSEEPVGSRVMTAVVAAARDLARPGDTVLLAPAGESFDQFTGYAARGEAFADAARAATR